MSSKVPRFLSLLLLLLAMSLGAWAFVSGRTMRLGERKETTNSTTVSPMPSLEGAGPRALDPVQNVRFTLYNAGILPRELHLDKGLVSIAIEDRTRQSSGLVIQLEVGNSQVAIGRVQPFTNLWRGRAEFRLAAGTYAIFDASRPANRAKLVVAP
jgi:hypothetical protein